MTAMTTVLTTPPTLGIDVPWGAALRDPAVQFFGIAAVLTLAISVPATWAGLAPFHATGPDDVLLPTAAMLVFEIGAVGAKLITLAVPQWSMRLNLLTLVLLLLTTLANYAHGLDLFLAASLPPSLAAVRSDPTGQVLITIGAAALFPSLLYAWLTAVVARCKMLAVHHGACAAQRDTALVQVEQLTEHVAHLVRERDTLQVQVLETAAQRDTARESEQAAYSTLRHMEAQLSQVEREYAQLRDTPPALPDTLMVQIGGKSYSVRDAASRLSISPSTLVRKLAGEVMEA